MFQLSSLNCFQSLWMLGALLVTVAAIGAMRDIARWK